MKLKTRINDGRTEKEVLEYFKDAKELSDKLRNATSEERKAGLYLDVYTEMFRRHPDSPYFKTTEEAKQTHTKKQMNILKNFITQDTVFLEVGSGDCLLCQAIASHVRWVYSVDICSNLGEHTNTEFILSDGVSVGVKDGVVDIAYSNQLAEHMHPNDFKKHLRNVRRSLKSKGIYIILTPHHHIGPVDSSKYFCDEASGFHLKEYTFSEIRKLILDAGFSEVKPFIIIKSVCITVPSCMLLAYEYIIGMLPKGIRRAISNKIIIRNILGMNLKCCNE